MSKRQRLREISSSDSETDTRLVNDKSVENSEKDSSEQCSETINMKTSKNDVNSPGKNDCDEIPKTCNSTKRKSSRTILDSSEDDTNQDSSPKCESIQLVDNSSSDSDDSVLKKSSTNKKRKIMSSDSESNSDNSSESCRKSATSRNQERRKCREELFKGLKDSRRKSR